MTLRRAVRAWLLAPFGGERALQEAARRRARAALPENPYDELRGKSTDATVREERLTFASLVFVPSGAERRARLRELACELPPGGFVAVLGHNAPRGRLARALAWSHLAMARALLGGDCPAARLRWPLARELRDLGLEVVALRLLAAECFQVVVARKPPAPG